MCGCFGFSFGCSIGFGSGAFARTFGGGGGGGATGISVTGIVKGTTEYLSALSRSGKKIGITTKNVTSETWSIALRPMRSQRFSPSGSKSKRAGTGFVPMAVLQDSFRERKRPPPNPTPRLIPLVGGSAIIDIILVSALKQIPSGKHDISRRDPQAPSSL